MANVKERFSDNGDDRRISDIELLSGLPSSDENRVQRLSALTTRYLDSQSSERALPSRSTLLSEDRGDVVQPGLCPGTSFRHFRRTK